MPDLLQCQAVLPCKGLHRNSRLTQLCTPAPYRVGNHLGAGNPAAAKTAAVSALAITPVILAVTGTFMVEPHCQSLLLWAFAGNRATPALRGRLQGLLRTMVALQACDCVQCQMQGVIQVR